MVLIVVVLWESFSLTARGSLLECGVSVRQRKGDLGQRVLGGRAESLLVSAAHVLSVSIETRVQIQESVRGKDVFVIQTMSK